jgi:hypothetical protein
MMRPNKGLVLTVHLCRPAAGTAPRSTSPSRWADEAAIRKKGNMWNRWIWTLAALLVVGAVAAGIGVTLHGTEQLACSVIAWAALLGVAWMLDRRLSRIERRLAALAPTAEGSDKVAPARG